jgi:hypothetical protein
VQRAVPVACTLRPPESFQRSCRFASSYQVRSNHAVYQELGVLWAQYRIACGSSYGRCCTCLHRCDYSPSANSCTLQLASKRSYWHLEHVSMCVCSSSTPAARPMHQQQLLPCPSTHTPAATLPSSILVSAPAHTPTLLQPCRLPVPPPAHPPRSRGAGSSRHYHQQPRSTSSSRYQRRYLRLPRPGRPQHATSSSHPLVAPPGSTVPA